MTLTPRPPCSQGFRAKNRPFLGSSDDPLSAPKILHDSPGGPKTPILHSVLYSPHLDVSQETKSHGSTCMSKNSQNTSFPAILKKIALFKKPPKYSFPAVFGCHIGTIWPKDLKFAPKIFSFYSASIEVSQGRGSHLKFSSWPLPFPARRGGGGSYPL